MPGVRIALTCAVAVTALLATPGAAGADIVMAGKYASVSTGHFSACAIRPSAALRCWGEGPGFDPVPPPTGKFGQVSLGDNHACAIRTDATLVCWGDDRSGETSPPSGSFTQVTSGQEASCALRTDQNFLCWGRVRVTPPAGTYSAVSIGAFSGCGIRTGTATLACWGLNNHGQSSPPPGAFKQISASGALACGISATDTLTCWGDNEYGQATAPAGTFNQVDGSYRHACALGTDAALACWGDDGSGQASPPAGTFKQVSTGASTSCAVRTDSAVVCWGTPFELPDISAKRAFKLRSAARCVNRRRGLTVRVRRIRDVAFVRARAELTVPGGKRTKRLGRAKVHRPVTFRRLPAGEATLIVTAYASDGRDVQVLRTYRSCG